MLGPDSKMGKVRVLLVDSHAIVRAGVQMLIEAQPDLEVVGGLKGGQAALDKVCETQPDVTIIDIRMAETSGIKAIEHLLQACPNTRILVLTGCDNPAYALAALAAGALGYMSKRATPAELLTAIHSVHQGRHFVDPVLAGPLLQDFLRKRATSPLSAAGTPTTLLSPREREVLILLAQGYTNRQVADQIGLSVKTVETYRARIMDKLALHSRAELIRYAHECGLLSPKAGV
jgi:two-component system response regulator NreC